jgi:hypothetical protein
MVAVGADPDPALIDVLSKVQQTSAPALPTAAADRWCRRRSGQHFALMYLSARSSTVTRSS